MTNHVRSLRRAVLKGLLGENRTGSRSRGSRGSAHSRLGSFEQLEARRLLTAGALDPTFGNSGLVTTNLFTDSLSYNDSARSISLQQADGKMIVAGHTGKPLDKELHGALARYNADGTIDTSFGDGGRVVGEGTGRNEISGAALQNDGRIIVIQRYGGDFALARYHTDGTADTSFGTGGRVTTDFAGGSDSALSVAVQADGKIVVAGSAINFSSGSANSDFALARYNTDGTLDSSFGVAGMVLTDFAGSSDSANSMAIQADGRIVAAGHTFQSVNGSVLIDFAVARFNADGSLDTSFDGDGRVTTDFSGSHDVVASVVIQADGKVVAAGQALFGSGGERFALSRYNIDGSLDTSFEDDGLVTTDFPGAEEGILGITIQSDGRIVAAGSASGSSGERDFALARYNTNGTLDTSFDTDGRLTTDFAGGRDEVGGVAIQADGKIVAAGSASENLGGGEDFALARYNVDGSLDSTFGTDGLVTTDLFTEDISSDDRGRSISLQQPDGKIVVAGQSRSSLPTNRDSDGALARYHPDGTLDTSFGAAGRVLIEMAARDEISDAALQADGRIVVVGRYRGDFFLTRYNSDGSLDTSFGKGGRVTTDFAGSADTAYRAAIQTDGKIVVAGSANNPASGGTADFALARYHSDGTLDMSFGSTGRVMADFAGSADQANGLAIQADGKIVAVGRAYQVGSGQYDFALARLNADGLLDATFGAAGMVVTDIAGYGDVISDVAIQSDGKIVAAGKSYTDGSGGDDFALARYNTDGSLDTSFDLDGLVTTGFGVGGDSASAVAIQMDGKIVAAGEASDDGTGGETNFALARYHVDGSPDTSFGTEGLVTTDFGGSYDGITGIAIQADGRIVAAGSTYHDTSGEDLALARYLTHTPSGDVDDPIVIGVTTVDDVVDATDGVTSLREAVIEANRIPVHFEIRLVQSGTYWLNIPGVAENESRTGDLDIFQASTVTIVGVGAGETIINAGGDGGSIAALGDRVFHVHSGASLAIEGVTVTGGTASGGGAPDNQGGGFFVDAGTLMLTESEVVGNATSTVGDGGGIYNTNSGSVTIVDSTISENSARDGGGIGNKSGFVTIVNSTVSENSGRGVYSRDSGNVTITSSTISRNTSGGIYNSSFGSVTITSSIISENSWNGIYNSNAASVTITNSILFDNSNSGIHNGGSSSVTIIDSTLSGNTSISRGGAIWNEDFGTLTVANSTLTENTAVGDGGAIFNGDFGIATISNSTISGNSATNGGGIHNRDSGSMIITGSIVSGNSTTASGGGILNNGPDSTMAVINSDVSDNSTAGYGGGIWNAGGSVIITESTLSGNLANFLGGGVHNQTSGSTTIASSTLFGNSASRGGGVSNSGIATITHSTITGNVANEFGGGVYNANSGSTATVTHSTITGNRADADENAFGFGGGLTNFANAILHHTVVAGNFIGTGIVADDVGSAVDSSSSFNLIGDAATAGGMMHAINGNIVGDHGSGTLDIHTILDTTLADNGGPTFTHALVPGSPAVNSGDPAFDPMAFDPPLVFDQRGEGFDRVLRDRIDIGAFEAAFLNSPPVADAGGPYVVSEDATVHLDASATTDAEQDPLTLIYHWDFDGDAVFGETGAEASRGDEVGVAPAFSALGLAPGSAVNVSLLVTDDQGENDPSSTTVTVAAADPTDLGSVVENIIASGQTQVELSASQANAEDFLQAIGDLPPNMGEEVEITIVLEHGTVGQGQILSVPAGYVLIVDGANGQISFVGRSPALTVVAGKVIVVNDVTLTNTTDAPTILVQGGSLTLRDVLVEETDGGDQAAIEITGGTVNLGTEADPGGNTFNIRGPGDAIRNSTATDVPALGNTFQIGGARISDPFAIEDEVYHALDLAGLGTVNFVAGNINPRITIDSVSPTVLTEGAVVRLVGRFADVGSVQSHSAIWTVRSNKTNEVVTIPGVVVEHLSSGSVTADYVFEDSGAYTVTLEVRDSGGLSGIGTTALTVANVAPRFDAGPDQTLALSAGGTFTRIGIPFADSGTADVWTGTVNYGDGSGDQTLLIDRSTMTFDLNHTYAIGGGYSVSVTVNDDDNGSFTDTFDLSVPKAKVELSSATASGIESSGGNLPMLLVSGTFATDQSIELNVAGGTATAGGDFSNTATVHIPAGVYDGTLATAAPINLSINNETIVESDESIVLTLANPSLGLTIQDASGNGTTQSSMAYTILNDDFLGGLVFNDLNNDGEFDAASGDRGIGGVLMQLVNQADGSVVDSQPTDSAGRYEFAVTLPAGDYKIVELVDELVELGLLDGRETAGVNGGIVDNSQNSNEITDIKIGGSGTANEQAVDYLFAEIEPSDVFGTVWRDFNDDGAIDYGEVGIDGATLTLAGTDDRGAAVSRTHTTVGDGGYAFTNLRPGTYSIEETQPAGFDDGKESLGGVTDSHGVATPAVDAGFLGGNDRFAGIVLVPGSEGDRYNLGERPQASDAIGESITAGIGFWHNKNGEALIESLNEGPASTHLGNWLAATFPNMYGPGAYYHAPRGNGQDMDLTGKSNTEVAEIFQFLHKRNKKTAVAGGPPKVEAQVMALALATYVTSEQLAGGAFAASYGFHTSTDGIAYASFKVLDTLTVQEADDLGLTPVMDIAGRITIIDLLLTTDDRAAEGLLYDGDGDGSIDGVELLRRRLANDLYTAINEY